MFDQTIETTTGEKMDAQTRRTLLFCLSQPTNPVPGAVLSHVLRQASYQAIRDWEAHGWIARSGTNYVLTETGCAAISAKPAVPPESYFPMTYNFTIAGDSH